MQELVYVGPHDAVDVDLPIDGYPKVEVVTVVNGEAHAFSEEDAERLLEQPDNWKPAAAKSAKAQNPAKAGSKE